MDKREFFRAYARSPLGIASFLIALCAGAFAAAAGLSLLLALAAAAAALALFAAVGLAAGFAQRAVAGESGRASLAKSESRLETGAEARKRLAGIRLMEPSMAAARDLLVLEAGRFIEDCRRAGTYDPIGVEAIVDSLALVDAWLKEADESSVERRFGLADEHPFPEAAGRTAEALRAKAALVSARRAEAIGEIPGADRLAIEEELK